MPQIRCSRRCANVPERALIVEATPDDLSYFAGRRVKDEHGRRLYFDLARMTPHGVYVAKDEGTPIGIAIVHPLADEWFFSELYVEPSFQKRGIARRLLQAATNEARDVIRSGLVEASGLGAVAFYLQRGIFMQTPVLQIAGAIPHENELARMAAGDYRFITEPLDPVGHRVALLQLDREVRGSSRADDHLYFSEHARGFIFRRGDELAGYAYVWPSGRIGPMVSASQAYSVQFLSFALAALRQTHGATWCTTLVPGTNLRVLRAFLRAGLLIEATLIFASDNTLLDLSRYVGFHPLLF